jgi:hypothetical protein
MRLGVHIILCTNINLSSLGTTPLGAAKPPWHLIIDSMVKLHCIPFGIMVRRSIYYIPKAQYRCLKNRATTLIHIIRRLGPYHPPHEHKSIFIGNDTTWCGEASWHLIIDSMVKLHCIPFGIMVRRSKSGRQSTKRFGGPLKSTSNWPSSSTGTYSQATTRDALQPNLTSISLLILLRHLGNLDS